MLKLMVISVPAVEVELASDALWALGVQAVEERDVGGPTEDHYVELWTSLGDDVDIVTRAADGFPARWRWRLVEVDESVASTWRAHAVATWVERDLVICPAWVELDAPDDAIVVRIEPAGTFGLGDHSTTMLTLRAMRRCLFPGATVLDVGCGSGVLAVAACRLGAARAEAIDIFPAAAAVADDNAARNGVAGRVSASTTPIGDISGHYDIVVANILAPTLIALSDDLKRVLATAGVLVISGVLADRYDHVLEALRPLKVIATDHLGGWAAVTLRW
ncbi:MAG: 50S ribosomal protein L11 methyltransferase [Ilumatobacteraceae bacterium]